LFRHVLSTLSLVALAGAAALVPTAASAATDGDLTWTVKDDTVVMTSATEGVLSFVYTCGSAGTSTQLQVDPGLFQPDYDHAKASAYDEDNEPSFTCDGTEQTLDAGFTALKGDKFKNGPAQVGIIRQDTGDDAEPTFEAVTITGVPLAGVTITANASPEPARKGKKITVKGTVKRDGKAYSKVKAALEFKPDGGDYAKVKTVTADSKGNLKTTVKADEPGTFRFTTSGTSQTEAGTSGGDFVDVIPVAKAYANCTALNKVYPYGVGKKGAHDKGGDVVDFTVDNDTYNKNKKSDRDKDGIACESA
jgi:Excalibur calcium-binding domain